MRWIELGLPDDVGEIEVKVEYIVSGIITFGSWKAAESCVDMIGERKDMMMVCSESFHIYICPFPELLDRKIALGLLDKLVWEPFWDREVMKDDWPISSGIGEGDREM